MKYKSVCLVATESIKDIGNLRNYLIEHSEHMTTFHFPLGYAKKASYTEQYSNGKKVYSREFPTYYGSSKAGKLISHYIYFVITLLLYTKRGSVVIVHNPIFCFLHSITSFWKEFRFVLFIGDYYPDNRGLMRVHHMLTNFYNRKLQHVIYLSPPLATIYGPKQSVPRHTKKYRKQMSLGIPQRFRSAPEQHRTPGEVRLGFIGVLREQQGLDILFQYLELEKAQNCSLEIIGDGYMLNHYKAVAERMGIQEKVTFYGFVDNPSNIIQHWDIGAALYQNTPDNLSIYCEPTKIKEYLSYGIPVITTCATYFSSEVHDHHAGEIIEETPSSVSAAIGTIMNEYPRYRNGAQALAKKYAHQAWYDTHFDFLRN